MESVPVLVVKADESHLPGIIEVENREILEGFAHFGVRPLELADAQAALEHAIHPWFVALSDGAVVGFCRSHPWKAREGYSRTCEVGVYVSEPFQGKGIAKALYSRLFEHLEAAGFHTVLAGIALPNPASVRLHESFGMQKVAHFPEMGFKLGEWRDVGYWTRLL